VAACIAVTALSLVPLASETSEATGSAAGPLAPHTQAREATAPPRVASEQCPAVRRALKFYMGRANDWREKMGAGTRPHLGVTPHASCPRYLLGLWVRKAHAARKAFIRWFEYEWHWQSWLPAKWYRIARCETGVRWDWNSGSYQGAFGFAVSSWDAFRRPGHPTEAYLATPRQQYEVALAIWRRFGFSGWGCRNA